MRVSLTHLVAVATSAAVVLEVVAVAGLGTGLVLMAVAAWFACSGTVFARAALGDAPAARLSAWFVGPALGFGLSVMGLLLLWVLGLQNWGALLAAPFLTIALAAVAKRGGGVDIRVPTLTRSDTAAAVAAMLLVPLISFAPYDMVRHQVPDGEAYRAYFTADFVWAMSATAELAKGDVPPDNPFRHGEPMRYYWMSHLLSGAMYRSMATLGVRSEPVILVNGLMFGLAFVPFMYWLARSVGATTGWAFVGVATAFIANSYEGADMIRAVITHGDTWETLRETNIDAVSRWFYKGMAVDGLHRLFLYQPHHLTGYVLSLSALWLVGLATSVAALSVALWCGILLAAGLLFSTFAALIVAPATALLYAWRLSQQRAWRDAWQCATLAGAPLGLGVFLTRVLGYTNPADGLLMTIGVNPVALKNWSWVVFVSFGPLLLFGVPALLRPSWVRHAGAAPAALAMSAVSFYFLVDVPDMGGVWVGWRSGHMLLIAFAVAGAAGLSALWSYAESKAAVAVVAVVAVLLALPTVAIDVFNAQDITNRHDGAGFPWTLIITPAEREALDWIRDNTPPDAVVQAEPFVRDQATWAYVPAFAERRMAAGLPISMIPHHRYAEASRDVRFGIFTAVSALSAHEWANFLAIDYVLIGERERRAYGPQVDRMKARPDLFEVVFRNDAILLLKVVKTRSVAAHPQ